MSSVEVELNENHWKILLKVILGGNTPIEFYLLDLERIACFFDNNGFL